MNWVHMRTGTDSLVAYQCRWFGASIKGAAISELMGFNEVAGATRTNNYQVEQKQGIMVYLPDM